MSCIIWAQTATGPAGRFFAMDLRQHGSSKKEIQLEATIRSGSSRAHGLLCSLSLANAHKHGRSRLCPTKSLRLQPARPSNSR